MPSGSDVFTHTPIATSHATVAHGPGSGHGLTSLHDTAQPPPMQTPAWSIASVHAVPSPTGGWLATPPEHLSAVHASPSFDTSASSSWIAGWPPVHTIVL